MNKNNKKERKVYVTSDSHFNHGNIIKYCDRPFLSEEDKKARDENGGNWHSGSWKGAGSSRWRISKEAIKLMDDTIIDNINEMVGEDDILWHLGDFCFAKKYEYYQKCKEYRDRIKCKDVRLIWGNHDHRNIRDLFSKTYDLTQVRINDKDFILSHYAMAIWNKSHRKSVMLYGHSHSTAEAWLDRHMPGRRSMDVGIDNAKKIFGEYRPFSIDEIMDIMKNRQGHSMDHHIDPNAPTEEELI